MDKWARWLPRMLDNGVEVVVAVRPKEFVAPKPNQAERHEAKAPACRPEA